MGYCKKCDYIVLINIDGSGECGHDVSSVTEVNELNFASEGSDSIRIIDKMNDVLAAKRAFNDIAEKGLKEGWIRLEPGEVVFVDATGCQVKTDSVQLPDTYMLAGLSCKYVPPAMHHDLTRYLKHRNFKKLAGRLK